MKKFLSLSLPIIFSAIFSLQNSYAQNVGIGTITPNADALLHVDLGSSTTKGLLVTGSSSNLATVPDLGNGSRLMFYPGLGAFRAGRVDGAQWNNGNVGIYSTAMGYNTTAKGFGSTAMGYNTTAGENGSIAVGYSTTASGASSTAMGYITTASGNASTALGTNTTASAYASTSMGSATFASGNYSTAMGTLISTNGKQGAFGIGDSDPSNGGITYIGLPDEFVGRFWNGYYLLTGGSGAVGVQIGHNGNSWLSICDKNRKENFEPLGGEDVLQKIAKLNFTSWNYKMQDPKMYRHYGIMAQDFYAAFGHDKYGTVGNDTTVNPIDMIGIDMTAIQALEKRTAQLKVVNEKLKNEDAILYKKIADVAEVKNEEVTELKKENENLRQSVAQLQIQFDQQQKAIAQSLQQIKTLAAKQTDKETVAIK